MSERVITPALLREWELPTPSGDKRTRGTVLVVGGADATAGAAVLSGMAALRTGAGVLQICCGPGVAAAMAVQVPEAYVSAWTDLDTVAKLAKEAGTVVIGPGLDDIDHATDLLHRVVEAAPEAGLVVDAYALGALSHSPKLLLDRSSPAVLTPNGVEAEVLGSTDPAELAQQYGAVISLHGHVAEPGGGAWREESGDIGLGTAGSGDVLAGLVAGLIARGAEPAQAACWAVYVHGQSGQRLAAQFGRTGFLARELVQEAPRTLAALQT
jgi:ADP-dependent NAD(P)H-hydrate dehydratase